MPKKSNVSILFSNVFMLLGEKLYSSPNVFIRENVQNAVDAIRLLSQEGRSQIDQTRVEVRIQENVIEVEDWGIGMSEGDLREYFWTIGKSSKNNPESIRCNVIGKFGIGAFANFGICRSLEVQSWRQGFEKIKSRVLKEDLLKDKTDYFITSDSSLKHYGTLIIGETEQAIDVDKLRAYLQEHVRYLPEKISFNGQLVSQNNFPSFPKNQYQQLSICVIPFGETEVEVSYYDREGKLHIELNSYDKTGRLRGSLAPETGTLFIYLNGFLISTAPRFSWLRNRLHFSGFMETNLVEPNVTREGLERDSSSRLEEFLAALSDETLEVLSRSGLMFQNPEVTKFIAQQSSEKASKYLKDFPVSIYGGKKAITLEEIIANHEKTDSKVLLVDSENLSLEVASMATNQNVLAVMLNTLSPDVRKMVAQYLKDRVNATSTSEFELDATPLKAKEITRKMAVLRAVIREVLMDTWALSDPQVVLCRVSGNNHISIQELGTEIRVLVNVDSTIFKNLEGFSESPYLKLVVGQLLIAPFLSDVLVRLLPKDLSIAIAMFKPKPHLVTVKKVSIINLIRGAGWKGPTEDCIEIKSIIFRDMEGYYIKLPIGIGEQLKPLIASSNPPIYLWFADTVVGLFETDLEALLMIQIRSRDLMLGRGALQGTAKVPRRPLIYESGVYIPIPVPQLRDLLPLDQPKDLEFGFRSFGVDDKMKEQIKEIDILK